jgi:hypothetical protein
MIALLGSVTASVATETSRKTQHFRTVLPAAAAAAVPTTLTIFMTWNVSATQGLTLLSAPSPVMGQYIVPPPAAYYPYMTGAINTAWMIADKNGTVAANCSYGVASGGSLQGELFLLYEGNALEGYAVSVSYPSAWNVDFFQALTDGQIIYNVYWTLSPTTPVATPMTNPGARSKSTSHRDRPDY